MSDGPVACPRCGVSFMFTLEMGYHCLDCHITWDARFPVSQHITIHDEQPDQEVGDDATPER